MQREQLNLTEEDGYEALRGHVAERAVLAREKYGPVIDLDAIRQILSDGEVMRFPTVLRFDAEALIAGEFAWAAALGDKPSDGFAIVVHPHFEERVEDLPLLIAYHIVTVNYLDVVTHVEAELFGATLLGLTSEEYYERLCKLADELPGPKPDFTPVVETGGSCGTSCGCG